MSEISHLTDGTKKTRRLVGEFIQASAKAFGVSVKTIVWPTLETFVNRHMYVVFDEPKTSKTGVRSTGSEQHDALQDFWQVNAEGTIFTVGHVNFLPPSIPDPYPDNIKIGFNFAGAKVGPKGNIKPLISDERDGVNLLTAIRDVVAKATENLPAVEVA